MKTTRRILLTVLVLLGAAAASEGRAGESAAAPVIVPSPGDPRIRHLSWPKITRTEKGTLVLAYSAGIGHNRGGSGLAVSLSTDDGRTFSAPRLLCYYPDDDPRYRDVGNLALGIGEDGSVILLAMAYTPKGENTIRGWRSEDEGKTWDPTDTSAIAENRTGSVFGHVFSVPGKGLAVCGHFREPKGDGIWIAYSEDNGRAWGSPQSISNQRYFEPAFVQAGGRLIGLVRENGAHAYHQFVSDDRGKTWQFKQAAIQGDPRAVHPSPFITFDPREPNTLHALVSERAPNHQISLWRADAETLKWNRVRRLAEGGGDWTYPWMTHLGGNDWFLVYYQGEKDAASIYGKRITIPANGQK